MTVLEQERLSSCERLEIFELGMQLGRFWTAHEKDKEKVAKVAGADQKYFGWQCAQYGETAEDEVLRAEPEPSVSRLLTEALGGDEGTVGFFGSLIDFTTGFLAGVGNVVNHQPSPPREGPQLRLVVSR